VHCACISKHAPIYPCMCVALDVRAWGFAKRLGNFAA